ncbi:outer membrane protein assembly factor BamE (lipoprotein component of BamABCDE complex) [Pseudomonas sp. TE3786]
MHPSLCATALVISLAPATLFATTVYRCEDHDGRVTFTHLGCPSDQQLQLQNADNPPPGGTAQETGKAAGKSRSTRPPKPDEEHQAVVGIGLRQDGCGNLLTASARRKAMIDKEVQAGMSRADVESMLGKPDSISSQNGKMRYNYVDKQDKGRKRSVSFDASGCVKP